MRTRRGRGERVSDECKVRLKLPAGEVRVMRLGESAITWNGAPATLATLADITEHESAGDEVRRRNLELKQRVAERKAARTLQQLLALAKERGYSPGWAHKIHNARQRSGV